MLKTLHRSNSPFDFDKVLRMAFLRNTFERLFLQSFIICKMLVLLLFEENSAWLTLIKKYKGEEEN